LFPCRPIVSTCFITALLEPRAASTASSTPLFRISDGCVPSVSRPHRQDSSLSYDHSLGPVQTVWREHHHPAPNTNGPRVRISYIRLFYFLALLARCNNYRLDFALCDLEPSHLFSTFPNRTKTAASSVINFLLCIDNSPEYTLYLLFSLGT